MQRHIIGFHQDNQNDWVAKLNCYHNQHVRHNPPFISRPWVITEQGRQFHLGQCLNCKLCDQLCFPEDLFIFKETTIFTENTMPQDMLKEHPIRTNYWAMLNVLSGELEYTVNHAEHKIEQYLIRANEQAVIVPNLPHHILIDGSVRFYLTFHQPAEIRADDNLWISN